MNNEITFFPFQIRFHVPLSLFIYLGFRSDKPQAMSSTAASKWGRSKPKASKSVTRSPKATLQFPVDRTVHSLKADKYSERVGTTPIYLSIILEYFAAEVTLNIKALYCGKIRTYLVFDFFFTFFGLDLNVVLIWRLTDAWTSRERYEGQQEELDSSETYRVGGEKWQEFE